MQDMHSGVLILYLASDTTKETKLKKGKPFFSPNHQDEIRWTNGWSLGLNSRREVSTAAAG